MVFDFHIQDDPSRVREVRNVCLQTRLRYHRPTSVQVRGDRWDWGPAGSAPKDSFVVESHLIRTFIQDVKTFSEQDVSNPRRFTFCEINAVNITLPMEQELLEDLSIALSGLHITSLKVSTRESPSNLRFYLEDVRDVIPRFGGLVMLTLDFDARDDDQALPSYAEWHKSSFFKTLLALRDLRVLKIRSSVSLFPHPGIRYPPMDNDDSPEYYQSEDVQKPSPGQDGDTVLRGVDDMERGIVGNSCLDFEDDTNGEEDSDLENDDGEGLLESEGEQEEEGEFVDSSEAHRIEDRWRRLMAKCVPSLETIYVNESFSERYDGIQSSETRGNRQIFLKKHDAWRVYDWDWPVFPDEHGSKTRYGRTTRKEHFDIWGDDDEFDEAGAYGWDHEKDDSGDTKEIVVGWIVATGTERKTNIHREDM
ncbi:hypothetical protein DFP72DRAFT_505187 [Ephemerocybe angulata]|uniref:Uncharacterized protein n=1 Tax=Ephemerocybe angulata TaxID=980116 RepID=A0A8H6M0E7_9AGAR|nr:hypothetical protein DFP72DRAFT_505187 [Tulosesus angulatus]